MAWASGTPRLTVAIVAVILLNASFSFVQAWRRWPRRRRRCAPTITIRPGPTTPGRRLAALYGCAADPLARRFRIRPRAPSMSPACASSRTALGADISLLTGTGGGIGTPGPGRRAGDPELRQDSYYPEWLLERRRRAEWALASVVATSYRLGVSTRRAEKLAKGMGVTKLSKSQVSVMTAELDEMVAGSGPGRWMPAPRARPCPRSRPSTTRTRTRVVVGAVPCWGMNLGRHPAVVKVAALRSRRAGGGDQMTAPRAPGAGRRLAGIGLLAAGVAAALYVAGRAARARLYRSACSARSSRLSRCWRPSCWA